MFYFLSKLSYSNFIVQIEDGQIERIIPLKQLERLIGTKLISKIEKESYLYCIKGLSRNIVSKLSYNSYAIDNIYKSWMRDKEFLLMDYFYLEDSLERPIIDNDLGYSILNDRNNYSFRILPHSQINITSILEFKPLEPKIYTKTLIIKNNLTGIETIILKGIGASIDLFFERKQSGSNLTKKIVLQVAEDYADLILIKNFSIKNFGLLPISISNISIGNSLCGDKGFKILNCEPFYIDSGKEHVFFISFTITNRKKLKRDLKLFINDNIMIINFQIVILNNKQALTFYLKSHAISKHFKIIIALAIVFIVLLRTYLNTSLFRQEKKNKNFILLNPKEELNIPLVEKRLLPIKKPKARNIDFFAFRSDKASINENISDKSSSMEKRSSSSFFNESFEVITEELNHYHGNIGPKKKGSQEEKIESNSNSKRNNFYDYFYGNSKIVDFDLSPLNEEFGRSLERKEHFE